MPQATNSRTAAPTRYSVLVTDFGPRDHVLARYYASILPFPAGTGEEPHPDGQLQPIRPRPWRTVPGGSASKRFHSGVAATWAEAERMVSQVVGYRFASRRGQQACFFLMAQPAKRRT